MIDKYRDIAGEYETEEKVDTDIPTKLIYWWKPRWRMSKSREQRIATLCACFDHEKLAIQDAIADLL